MKVFMLSLLLLSSVAHADTASSIKKAITNNIQHTFNEDEAAVMGDMHSQSPAYASTQNMLKQLFPLYDLKYELVRYEFVGADSEYAYAKVKQRTTKIKGPQFQNNELESLMIFKQENGIWKLWTQANLSVTYI